MTEKNQWSDLKGMDVFCNNPITPSVMPFGDPVCV